MSDESNPDAPLPLTLQRWSQRKLAAARTVAAEPAEPQSRPPGLPIGLTPGAAPVADAPAVVSEPASREAWLPAELPSHLPSLESLTFDSDFSAFMQPKVDEATRRAALKKLFSDPSFNVMDGLDIYVGDYTQSDPMPAGMLEKLSAVYAMLDPPPELKEPAVAADAAIDGTPTAPEAGVPAEPATAAPSSTGSEPATPVATDAAPASARAPNEPRG